MRTIHFLAILVGATSKSTGLNHYILLIVDNSVELLGGHTEQIANLVRQRTEIPDVCHGHHQLDMSATLTAYLLLSNLYTTTVAHNTLITNALILAAGALIVACRTEDALAEQAIALRLIGTIVDGFRLGNLTKRVFQDFLGRCKADGYLSEIIFYFCIFLESHI